MRELYYTTIIKSYTYLEFISLLTSVATIWQLLSKAFSINFYGCKLFISTLK